MSSPSNTLRIGSRLQGDRMITRSAGAKLIGISFSTAFAIWRLWSDRITEYRGGGRITDAGLWSYPRYRIERSQIPLFEVSAHLFKLAGLRPDQMTLRMVIAGNTEKARAELTKLKTNIAASLVDGDGGIVCKASGIPSDGVQENAWILTSSDDSAAFWHQSCVDVDIHNPKSNTLELRLTEVDSSSPRAFQVPTLSGGGIELP